jgi:hypothetical protein
VLVFPWRFGDGVLRRSQEALFDVSHSRRQMFSTPLPENVMLPFGDDALRVESNGRTIEIPAESVPATFSVVVVAISSSAERLHTVEWGPAALDAGGCIDWVEREVLFDALTESVTVDQAATESFSSGEPPRALVQPKAAASGDV